VEQFVWTHVEHSVVAAVPVQMLPPQSVMHDTVHAQFFKSSNAFSAAGVQNGAGGVTSPVDFTASSQLTHKPPPLLLLLLLLLSPLLLLLLLLVPPPPSTPSQF
jgi:hypothetical protein